MKTDLSPAAERAVAAARTASAVEELDLARLLAALIADDDSRPAELLAAGGCRVAELRAELVALPPKLTYQRKFLTLARETTTDHGEAVVTGEYLLLTLLAQDASWRTLIEKHGGASDQFSRNTTQEIIRTTEPDPTPILADHTPTQRVCDANANRVREALRVLDDYARLALNDARGAQTFKAMRHDFAAVLRSHPALATLESRDTVGDVGTTITTPGEGRRADVHEVARVNVKRLQEALRSLEEFGKVIDPAAAAKIEQLRYRSYTAEKDLFLAAPARQRLADAKLYLLVSSDACPLGLEATVRGAIAGGVSVVQLREKSGEDRTRLMTATQVRQWTRDAGALFIVNDRPDIARIVGADGVHLGQEDLPITEVRRLVPADMLIGVSTHNSSQLAESIATGADYVGVGPTFPSTTKQFETFAGLEFLCHAVQQNAVPAFAIGGINRDTIRPAVQAGATRVAVSAAITQAADPEKAARELLAILSGRS